MAVWAARAITAVIAVGAIGGAVVLCAALPKIAAVLLAAVLVAGAVFTTVPWLGQRVLAAICAAVIALLVLLALAVAIRWTLDRVGIEEGLPIWAGLIFALAVFAAIAAWYLHGNGFGRGAPSWLKAPSWDHGWLVCGIGAVALAFLVIIVPPVVVGLTRTKEKPVPKSQGVVSQIDVLLVSERSQESPAGNLSTTVPDGEIAPYAHAAGFRVRYSVGFRDGDTVRWTLAGSYDEADAIAALRDPDAAAVTAPAPLNDADRVLVLLVDATPALVEDATTLPSRRRRRGEVGRWRRVAADAAPSGTTTYALLQTTRTRRLATWKHAFIQPGTDVRRGAALSVQGLGGRSVTDGAVRLAVAAPTTQEDYSLALRHRPILRFDRDEQAPRPLAIEDMFARGDVQQCFSRRSAETKCEPAPHPGTLRNGDTHLELTLPRAKKIHATALREEELVADIRAAADAPSVRPQTAPPPGTLPAAPVDAPPLGGGSAIYVHPVPADTEDARLLYLDYWWYLPYNPAKSGSGAFCGPGLVIPGVTCFDHVSDWEGMTVVLDRTTPGREPKPVAVLYAQHAHVFRYEWEALDKAWDDDPDVAAIREEAEDGAARPVVFVARGTHAGYPLPCEGGCEQETGAEEKPHDGDLPWAGNTLPECGSQPCLRMLPTARGGREPALWNAFEGPWGARSCFLTHYCDSGSPPAAPGQQDRYEEPRDDDGRRRP
jgi:hypothetical protein